MSLLAAGETYRHVGSTNYNVRSSRSHTIFRVVIESKVRVKGDEKGKPYISSYGKNGDGREMSVIMVVFSRCYAKYKDGEDAPPAKKSAVRVSSLSIIDLGMYIWQHSSYVSIYSSL